MTSPRQKVQIKDTKGKREKRSENQTLGLNPTCRGWGNDNKPADNKKQWLENRNKTKEHRSHENKGFYGLKKNRC